MSRPLVSGAGLLAVATLVLILWPAAARSSTPDAQVKGDASVRVTFDAKPLACVVPGVEGRTLARAETEIRRSLCSVGKVRHSFSGKVRKGRVVSQSPQALARLKRGAKVDLVVSKGRR